MKSLYPLTFKTIYKDKIWGGEKIKTHLQKDFSPLPNCGETWELSGVEGNISVVKNGDLSGQSLHEVIELWGEDLLGKSVMEQYGQEFPLLIKFIDANDDLSIQVHPDDALAKSRHNSFGKTEMWYIMQADPGAFLYVGMENTLTKEEYKASIKNNTILDHMHKEPVEAGDVFFIPAGRVHSIGKGIMLAEIQQTSDITYRMYDFDRRDDQGNARELHTEESVDAIDFTVHDTYKSDYERRLNLPSGVVQSDYFETCVLKLNGNVERDLSWVDSFRILICTEGQCTLNYGSGEMPVQLGDVVLVPAAMKRIELSSTEDCTIIETYVPEQ